MHYRVLLVSCLSGLLGLAAPAAAFQYLVDPGLRENQVGIHAANTALFRQADQLESVVGEQGPVSPHWHLVSSLTPFGCTRIGCPGTPPEAVLSPTIDCLGDCTDGLWQVTSPPQVEPLSGGVLRYTLSRVCYTPDELLGINLVELSQDIPQVFKGSSPCRVFDLFVGLNRQSEPPGIVLAEADRPTLAGLTSLVVSFFHEVSTVSIGNQCQGFDLASTMASVQLSPVDGQQPLVNYQIVTYDSTNPPLTGFWWEIVVGGFNSVQVRGVSDGVDIYGLPLREPGKGGYLYTIDIADRLTQLLSAKGLDPDGWRVAGFYSGSYTYGQARIVSTHGLFSLVDDLPAE